MRRLLFLLVFVFPLLTFQQGCAFMQDLLGVESNSEEESTPPPHPINNNYDQALDRYFSNVDDSEAEEWLIKNATPEQKFKISSEILKAAPEKYQEDGSCRDNNNLFRLAVEWMERSAEENFLQAQRRLGEVYRSKYWKGEEGCESKKQAAVKWMRKAVENWEKEGGHGDQGVDILEQMIGIAHKREDDQFRLAHAYSEGFSGESYKKQGLETLKRLALEGHWGSQLYLANAYEQGQGVSLSHKQAYIWYYVLFLSKVPLTEKISHEKISHLRNILEAGEIVSAEATARKIFREIARKKADKNNK